MPRPDTSAASARPLAHGEPTAALPRGRADDAPTAHRRVLGRFRLERRLGAGGFGVVWQAWDEKLERDVAVKAIPRERAGTRVEREARAAARLNHPGIVALYELAADEHEVFLVSELVHGRTLAELEREGAVADRDVARVGAALCDALEHAHGRGVVHRDVKPQNVMVVAEPAAGAGFAKLTDFGVAQLSTAGERDAAGDALTRTGDVVGTLAYMAPEQAEGRRATPASDVYSLALTLYEAWTGANPVRASGVATTVRRLGRPLPPLGECRPDLPSALRSAIDAALAPDPASRPPPERLAATLRGAEPSLAEAGGLEEPATLRRVGITTATVRAPDVGGAAERGTRAEHDAFAAPTAADAAGASRGAASSEDAAAGHWASPSEGAARSGRRRAAPLLERAAAGVAAGALVLAALAALGPRPPFSPFAAAAAAAALSALLPRIGWLCAGLATCAWLASPEAGRPGTALVLGCALLPVPFLMPRAGLLWSAPALAPLLGAVGLAPAFVGLAALAPAGRRRAPHDRLEDGTPLGARGDVRTMPGRPIAGALRRAGLAAAGFAWLAAAELLTGRALLFGPPDGVLPRVDWQGSVGAALSDALVPLLSSPALAPALAWAALAPLVPLLVRGRSLALDLLGAAAWAAGLVAALGWAAGLLASTTELHEARGALLGAALGALAPVAVGALRRPRETAPARLTARPADYPEGAR